MWKVNWLTWHERGTKKKSESLIGIEPMTSWTHRRPSIHRAMRPHGEQPWPFNWVHFFFVPRSCHVDQFTFHRSLLFIFQPHEDGPLFYPVVSTINLGSHTFLDFFHPLNKTVENSEEVSQHEQWFNKVWKVFALYFVPRILGKTQGKLTYWFSGLGLKGNCGLWMRFFFSSSYKCL